MSSRIRPVYIVGFYILVTGLSVFAYHQFKDFREDLKFWIPQLFLMMLIVVTTLYVFYTAELVQETRQLQQRPMIRVKIFEGSELPGPKFEKCFERGRGLSDEVSAKVLGGQQLPPNYVIVELKNIGQTTIRECVARVKFTAADTSSIQDEMTLASEIERDKSVRIAVAPLASLWGTVVALEQITYGDGLRRYTDTSGERVFTQASSPRATSDD